MRRQIILAISALVLFLFNACSQHQKNTISTISISLDDYGNDTIHLYQMDPLGITEINAHALILDESGSGSLEVDYPENSFVHLKIGDFISQQFLSHASELVIRGEAADILNTLEVSGKGSLPIKYLLAKRQVIDKYNYKDGRFLFQLDSSGFWNRIAALNGELDSLNTWLKSQKLDKEVKELMVLESQQTSKIYILNYALVNGYTGPRYSVAVPYDENLYKSFSSNYLAVLGFNYEQEFSRPLWKSSGASQSDSLAYLFPKILASTFASLDMPEFAKDFYTSKMLLDYYWGHQSNPVIEKVYDEWENKYPHSISRHSVLTAKERLTSLSPGTPAPAITGLDRHGNEFSTEHWKGHVLYIDVWATWCSPCREKIPLMYALQEEFKNYPEVKFLFVSVDKDAKEWEDYLKELPEEIVHIRSNNPGFKHDYMSWGVPHYILIDPSGRILQSRAPDPDSREISLLLEEAIKQARVN